jgi:integrase/recombinase XerD
MLRHSFATNLYRRTNDILLVKEALRHRSVTSTLVYASLDAARLRSALNA